VPAAAVPAAAPAGQARCILGVDPGTRLAGYAVVRLAGRALVCRAVGTITLPPGWPLARRLARLSLEISRLVRTHDPGGVAVEQAIYAQNVRTALALGQARGVVVGAAALAGVEVFEYSPREVKRAVTGSGAASKAQVQGMVRRLLGLAAHPGPDEADAAALAICHFQRDAGAAAQLRAAGARAPAAGRGAAAAGGARGRRSGRWTAADVERLRSAGRIR
jgi:crossover junction endodeoxyribonuclease RuvC